MTKDEIRSLFIDFFRRRGHVLLPNLSLIPDDDTVLLTSAGVQQVQPFFLGMQRPPAPRLVNVQRCLRTVDLEGIGDDTHLTFFEMMGNWSIGDYFKRQSVQWSWELVTDVLGFPAERIWVSVYQGENGIDRDTYGYWREVGVPDERIVYLGDEDNWWAPGDTGPCGPDTEIFYDRGERYGCGKAGCKPGCGCERFLEFWNNVFTQYNREVDGSLTELPSQNVDTGAGLERWAMLLQEKESVYETDCLWPLVEAVSTATGARFDDPRQGRSLRIIADHGRALTFLIFDGVVPTPDGRGSVLRRLLRRAALHGRLLGLRRPFVAEVIVPAVVAMMQTGYPELAEREGYIAQVAAAEERQFLSTIERGFALAQELLDRVAPGGTVDGAAAFDLLQTHGFPLELLREAAEQRGLSVDIAGYDAAAERHRAVSASEDAFFESARDNKAYGEIAESLGRPQEFVGYDTLHAPVRVAGIIANSTAVPEAARGETVGIVLDPTPFYAESGGQVGDRGTLARNGATIVQVTGTQRPKGSALVVHRGHVTGDVLRVGDRVEAQVDPALRAGAARHHSATHLTHRALKDVLGEGVHQEGSVVEPDRFTFDFNLPRAVTTQEIAQVEGEVNRLIRADLPVETAVLPFAEAMKTGAMALFTEKYGDMVRVVTMGPSRELCGGTHVQRTGEIGAFFIVSESSVSAGIRRLECVAGEAAYRYARAQMNELREVARELSAQPGQIAARVAALREGQRGLERQLNEARQEIGTLKVRSLTGGPGAGAGPIQADGFQYLVQRVDADSLDDLKSQSDALKSRLAPCVVVLGTSVGGRAMFTASATQGLDARGVNAGALAGAAARAAGGKGGGNPTWGQGSAPASDGIDAGLAAARQILGALNRQ